MTELTPLFMDISSVYSGDELGLPYRDLIGEGTVGAGDLAVTQRGAGANLSVDVAAGSCWVLGDTAPLSQPCYRCRNDAIVNLGITPDPTNPRRVLIVAQIVDETFSGVGRVWQLAAIHGVPAASPATPALPASALPLALIAVGAGALSVVNANITDQRVRASVGGGSLGGGGGGGGSVGPQAIDLRNPQMSANPGNAFPTVAVLTAWEEWHWEFVKDVPGSIFGIVKMGASAPTAAKIVLSTAYNAAAGIARWFVSWASVADGASLNPASLAAIAAQDIAVPATARLRKDVTFVLGAQPGAGDIVIVQITHDGAHANDTVAVNSELLGAWFLPA